ncbi:heat shock protein HspQ [bacterium endosymbiont of Pedicinus badii]|uniref:heat shock protein HspQ n=1 Tax=bacterium endosymbiont of Pedicinus badii TaxID=1719126 RepID=UPI0009BB96A1|nr:heat shock protein HspQ [bacterium endosymbiont of Pedicinus badii]OQM34506.1 heat-shock protein HspQ [bacterium endosymbiont of Pedicinus badii]
MILSKFSIGQKVVHKLLGYSGVVIDADPEYALEKPSIEEISIENNSFKKNPWYHVIMEDEEGKPIHTYLAEEQLGYEINTEKSKLLYELSKSIRMQLQLPRLRN